MKTPALLAAIALALASPAFAASDHKRGHEHKPMHGGVVVEFKDMDYELVAKPSAIQLYLRGHGKPADMSKASAKLTLLTGTEKQEVRIQPSGRPAVQPSGHPA